MHPADRPQAKAAHIHLSFIVMGLFLILIGDTFLSEGISRTGLENAIISRHITSAELYNFWDTHDQLPHISRDYMPLGYLLEGWMMEHVSNSFLTEKVISVCLFLLCGFLIAYVWWLSGKNWRTEWIPLAFWLMVPVVNQTATQNLVELPHTICTLFAISAQMKLCQFRKKILSSGEPDNHRKLGLGSLFYNTGTALWLTVAFFFKGLASIYVFFYPAVVWLFSMREKTGNPLKGMLFVGVAFCLFVGGTCLISPSVSVLVWEYLSYRFQTWLHPEWFLQNIHIYWDAIKQVSLGFVALLAVWGLSMVRGKYGSYMAYWKHRDTLKPEEYENVRQAYIHFTLALIGVFTVLFDENPQVYSLLPALPMAAYGCAFVSHNTIVRLCNRSTDIVNGILASLATMLITIGLIVNFSHIDRYAPEEQDVLSDLHTILPSVKEGSTVSVTPELYENDGARAYFLRYKSITFDTHLVHPILLSMQPTIDKLNTPIHYVPSKLNTKVIFLYRKKKEEESHEGEWDFTPFEQK